MENTNNSTDTTTTKRGKKAERPKFNYPFATKAEILASQADFTVCLEHLGILFSAQTADEQATETTKVKNKSGFMSSHAVNGTRIAKKVASGEGLTDEDAATVRKIVCRYGTQLARHYRAAKMASNPELRMVAELFSAD